MKKMIAAAAVLAFSAGLAFAQAPAPAPATPAPAVTPPVVAPAAPKAAAPAAQAPAAAPKANTAPVVEPVKKAAAKKGPPSAAERTPESLACSAELDAKNIHGKPRQAAMRKCKAEKTKAAAGAPAAASKATSPAAAPGAAPAAPAKK